MEEILAKQIRLDIGYDSVKVIKAKIVIDDSTDDEYDDEYDDPIPNHMDHMIKFVAEDGTVIANGYEISDSTRFSIIEGRLRDGDTVGIETDNMFLNQPNQVDESWFLVLSEGTTNFYSKIKYSNMGEIKIHDLKKDINHLSKNADLRARIGYLEGALAGISMSNDIPETMKQSINKILKA